MRDEVRRALQRDRVIDISTKGRTSGLHRRIEIWSHIIDGRLFITGSPGRRGWVANLRADPAFTLHLKESVQADLPATALLVNDKARRREVLTKLQERLEWARQFDIDDWVERGPLVEVELGDDR